MIKNNNKNDKGENLEETNINTEKLEKLEKLEKKIERKRQILIDAQYEDETRVAIIEDELLIGYEQESIIKSANNGNIYLGRIHRVEFALQAVFVEYIQDKFGFLPIGEIAESLKFNDKNQFLNTLSVGNKIIVQVIKEERGLKGVTLSTFITVFGKKCSIVMFKPFVTDQNIGEEILGLSKKWNCGIRKNTFGEISIEDIKQECTQLRNIWKTISAKSILEGEIGLIHSESELIKRVLRDRFNYNTDTILVDGDIAFNKIKNYAKWLFQDKNSISSSIKQYGFDAKKSCTIPIPIFTFYKIEEQIYHLYNSKVWLKSGASIVINITEAMICIDVNSGKMKQGINVEDTAIKTNLEACYEIARQIELRNMSGLIVIDFIDMSKYKNCQLIEEKMESALKYYNSNAVIGNISSFGLMQISKKRSGNNIFEINTIPCQHCDGKGRVMSYSYVAIRILRAVDSIEYVNKEIIIYTNETIALYILNYKRDSISNCAKKRSSKIIVGVDHNIPDGAFKIEIIRGYEPVNHEIAKAQNMVDEEITLVYKKSSNTFKNLIKKLFSKF